MALEKFFVTQGTKLIERRLYVLDQRRLVRVHLCPVCVVEGHFLLFITKLVSLKGLILTCAPLIRKVRLRFGLLILLFLQN